MKRRVTVSSRTLKDGVKSLFLDYVIGGKRFRENLKLYIVPEKTQVDRNRNQETARTADAIRAKKEFEIEQIEAGVQVRSAPRLISFIKFMDEVISRYKNRSTRNSMETTRASVESFDKDSFVQEMDGKWFDGFVRHLESRGNNPNTIRKKCNVVKAILKEAEYSGIFVKIPKLKSILPKQEPSIREFLSMDELRLLDSTNCNDPAVKNAFLFCCFTGLRFSDCRRLTPSMIEDGTIVLRQEKTREPVRIPIRANAMKYIDMENTDKDRPFFSISKYDNVVNRVLRKWAEDAGVKKHVTFHVSRHTFATLLITSGNDIYSTMRLMGHTSVGTTIVYAKMVDDVKKKAIDLIPSLDKPK